MPQESSQAKSTNAKQPDQPKPPSVWRDLKELKELPNSTAVDLLIKSYNASKDAFEYTRKPDISRDSSGTFIGVGYQYRVVAWMPIPELTPP